MKISFITSTQDHIKLNLVSNICTLVSKHIQPPDHIEVVCKPALIPKIRGTELTTASYSRCYTEARVNLYPDALTALNALNDDFTMPFELPTIEI